MTDWIHVSVGEMDHMLDLLARALPFVEEAANDPAYKKGAVAELIREIREELE